MTPEEKKAAEEKAAEEKKAAEVKEALKKEIRTEVKAELKEEFAKLDKAKKEANVVIEKSQEELKAIAEAKAEAAVEGEDAGNSAQESRKLAKANRKMVKFEGNGKNKSLGITIHEVEKDEAKMFAKVGWGKIVK